MCSESQEVTTGTSEPQSVDAIGACPASLQDPAPSDMEARSDSVQGPAPSTASRSKLWLISLLLAIFQNVITGLISAAKTLQSVVLLELEQEPK